MCSAAYLRHTLISLPRPDLHPYTYWGLTVSPGNSSWVTRPLPPTGSFMTDIFYETTAGLQTLKGQTARQQRSIWMAHFLAVAWWRGYCSSSLSPRLSVTRHTDSANLKECVKPLPARPASCTVHHMGHYKLFSGWQISSEEPDHSKGICLSLTGKGSLYVVTLRRCGWFHFIWSEKNLSGWATAELLMWKSAFSSGGDWVGFVSAGAECPCCCLYTFLKRKKRERRSCKEVGWVWLLKPKGILAVCVLWETRSERHWTAHSLIRPPQP